MDSTLDPITTALVCRWEPRCFSFSLSGRRQSLE